MSESMRIKEHPILGADDGAKYITIYFEGKPIEAKEGEPVAVSLAAAGIKALRYTQHRNEPRGIYCAQGKCSDCMMIVNGRPNVRTCVTPAEDGMRVEIQHGLV